MCVGHRFASAQARKTWRGVPLAGRLERSHMAHSEKVQGPASYFPSIEKTYGHPIEHWLQVLRGAGDLRHMELVNMLKSAHGLGHGHANALVAHFLAKR